MQRFRLSWKAIPKGKCRAEMLGKSGVLGKLRRSRLISRSFFPHALPRNDIVVCVPQGDFLEYADAKASEGKGFTHVFFNACLHNFLEPGEALARAAELLREVLKLVPCALP